MPRPTHTHFTHTVRPLQSLLPGWPMNARRRRKGGEGRYIAAARYPPMIQFTRFPVDTRSTRTTATHVLSEMRGFSWATVEEQRCTSRGLIHHSFRSVSANWEARKQGYSQLLYVLRRADPFSLCGTIKESFIWLLFCKLRILLIDPPF